MFCVDGCRRAHHLISRRRGQQFELDCRVDLAGYGLPHGRSAEGCVALFTDSWRIGARTGLIVVAYGARRGFGKAGVLIAGALAAAILSACSREPDRQHAPSMMPQQDRPRYDPRYGSSASPRVYAEHQQIPKGGGSYKIGSPYKIANRWYTPVEDRAYDRAGIASWYGADFHGRKTANGEVFDMGALTAAHPTLPIPSYAYVTNLDNDRTILVRINDRGPYAHDRIIDLSRQSARALGTESKGLGNVRVRYAGRAPLDGNDMHERRFLAGQPWARQFAQTAGPPTGRMALGAETRGD